MEARMKGAVFGGNCELFEGHREPVSKAEKCKHFEHVGRMMAFSEDMLCAD